MGGPPCTEVKGYGSASPFVCLLTPGSERYVYSQKEFDGGNLTNLMIGLLP